MYGSAPGFGVMTGGVMASTGFTAAGFIIIAVSLVIAGGLLLRSAWMKRQDKTETA
ncbi:hypothetical protein [Leifsonia xyli]|uniref:hypothetical protein n=1 Tax=Leifsonia xyli TaxID=1575 RepID=UPI000B01376A